jgi:hypothetical protein
MSVWLQNRRDALVWRAIDRIFDGADAKSVIAELELDLLRLRAEALLSRTDRLITLLRETDPDRIPARKAA